MEASTLPASVGLARARLGLGAPLLRLRSDEQLVSLFRAGNEDAFRVIHDRYRARMLAYARQMLSHTSADAEDAVQEIFVRAYAGLRTNRRDLALRAWLYRIAHNRCIDELRKPRALAVDGVEELGEAAGPSADPVVQAEQREVLRRLIVDVQRLPEQQRSALLMRELGGMPYGDLSGALGVSVPAIKSLLVRARVGLAQANEARDTACATIREDLIESHDRGVRASGVARRHLRDCEDCRTFRTEIQGVSRGLGMLLPVALGPLGLAAKLLGLGGLGGGGGAAASSGAGAAAGSTAVASTGAAAGGGAIVSGTAAAGGGALATVGAAAGAGHVVTILAATVVAAGGAIGIQHEVSASAHHRSHHPAVARVSHPPTASAVTGHATPSAPATIAEAPRASGAPQAAPAPPTTPSTTTRSTTTSTTATRHVTGPQAMAEVPPASFPVRRPTLTAIPEPTSTDPTVTDPTATDPTATDPTVTDPTATDPTATVPTTTLPTATTPGNAPIIPPVVTRTPVSISGSSPAKTSPTGTVSPLKHGNPGTATGVVPTETVASTVTGTGGGGAAKARTRASRNARRGAPAATATVR